MKKITLLFFAVICMIFTVNAQKTFEQMVHKSSQLDALQQKMANMNPGVTGSITNYFTAEEQVLMNKHFYTPNSIQRGINAQSTAYGINNGAGEFSSFDTEDGVLTTIGVSAVVANFEGSGAVDPNDTATAYVLDNTGEFFSVDVATGAYTALGTIAGNWTGLEFDPTTGVLYGILITGATPNVTELYTIDIAGLATTLIGATGMEVGIGIAIDGTGNAFAWDVVDDNLYSVDLTSGATTVIGSIGFNSGFGQGFFWDSVTDSFFMTTVDTSNGNALELRSVDVATGATTVVGVNGAQVAWSSGSFVVPSSTDACDAYTSSPAIPFIDNDFITDIITVPATAGTITDLNVAFDISHTWVADLEITLTSPAGTSVDLLFDPCGSDDDMNIMLDDEGVAIVCASPTVGDVIPDNPLSAFDGEVFEGDWTITIADDASGDTGSLNTWCLIPTLTFPCGDPTAGVASNVTHDSADLGWTAGPDGETMWDVEWGAAGFTPGTGAQFGMADDTADNPLAISGLTALTDYEFYVRAVCNSNDNSGWAGPFAFTTLDTPPASTDACGAYTSNPALAFIDNDFVTDIISVPAGLGTIDDLNVALDISHTWIADLEITLTSPAGTSVDLLFDPCGSDDDMNIMLDDEGLAIVCASPTVGNVIPDNPLSAFDGENFEGDWTITVADDAGGDTGFLNTWCLIPSLNTSSVSELEAVGFNYYPNPVSNDLFLTARENISNVAIFNMLGQEVKSVTPSTLETTINMSNLATGTYFVKAQVGDAVGTFKVVKK